MDIEAGNRRIAEFMGLTYKEESDPFDEQRIIKKYICNGHPDKTLNQDVEHHFQIVHLKYHSSWDWLMPVVEKILLENDLSQLRMNDSITVLDKHEDAYSHFPEFETAHYGTNLKENIYKAVVDFVTPW